MIIRFMLFATMVILVGFMITYAVSNNDFDEEFNPKASAYNDYRNKMNQYIKM